MRALTGVLLLFVGLLPQAVAEQWVAVGADPEAKFYVDVDSIVMVNDTLHVIKRGVYTHTLTESIGGGQVVFKETRGLVELDCELRVNRITRIDMLSETGEVACGHYNKT